MPIGSILDNLYRYNWWMVGQERQYTDIPTNSADFLGHVKGGKNVACWFHCSTCVYDRVCIWILQQTSNSCNEYQSLWKAGDDFKMDSLKHWITHYVIIIIIITNILTSPMQIEHPTNTYLFHAQFEPKD